MFGLFKSKLTKRVDSLIPVLADVIDSQLALAIKCGFNDQPDDLRFINEVSRRFNSAIGYSYIFGFVELSIRNLLPISIAPDTEARIVASAMGKVWRDLFREDRAVGLLSSPAHYSGTRDLRNLEDAWERHRCCKDNPIASNSFQHGWVDAGILPIASDYNIHPSGLFRLLTSEDWTEPPIADIKAYAPFASSAVAA